jgi:hypothetical protein
MTVKEETRELTLRQRHGRAINAVAELLRRRLSVPNIYLEPPSSLVSADILAVDRGGAGDLHGVEIKLERDLVPFGGQRKKPSSREEINDQAKEAYETFNAKYLQNLRAIHRQVMSMPVHYRYLALPADSFHRAFSDLAHFGLFPENGVGRLGFILITDRQEEPPAADLAVVPERFRVDPAKLKAIETKLLSKSRPGPDIYVRI